MNLSPSDTPVNKSSRDELRLVFALMAIYFVVEIVYSFLSNATWDDDCPTRYYNTLDAFNHPKNFIDLWNRPLFVILFSIPVHISRFSIPIIMSLLTTASAWALYRYCKLCGMRNAFMVVPFLLFQAFVFGISRNAETEPLAIALFSFGLLNHVRRNFLWFALLGGLLPLARLELSPLLIFWVVVLVHQKQWKYIILLFLPLIIWNLFGYFSSNDPLWLFHSAAGDGMNRYGAQTFGNYFQRYIFVTGPIIFYFFFIGICNAFTHPLKNTFILWQFVIGFFIYVVFSWKLSMGDAAGFLRNLIPLSPFAAILALRGFNCWLDSFAYKQPGEIPGRTSLFTFCASFAAVILTFIFFSQRLLNHHTLTDEKDYFNLLCVGILALIPILQFIKVKSAGERFRRTVIASVVSVSVLFAVITENWKSNLNPEREVMQQVSDLCLQVSPNETIYANHVWFYWSNHLDKTDPHYKAIRQDELARAPESSLVVWDSHYSPNLAGNVEVDDLLNSPDFIELFRLRSSDHKFVSIVFRRFAGDSSELMQEYNRTLDLFPTMSASIYVNRGLTRLHRLRDTLGGISDFDTALKLDAGNIDAWVNKGIVLFQRHDYDGAVIAFRKATEINPEYAEAYFNEGVALGISGHPQEAINCYTTAIKLNNNYVDAYRNRALIYDQTRNLTAEIDDLNKVIALSPNDADGLENRGIAYYQMNNKVRAKIDLDRAIILQSDRGVAYFYRGLIASENGDEGSACTDFAFAYQFGYAEGKIMWLKHCQ